jgi:hypothetical protein
MADPVPGRPRSQGRTADRRDAGAVLAVVKACRTALDAGRPRTGPRVVVREALWFLWELPRLPRPLVQSKYPKPYPWSPEARRRFEHSTKRPQGGWGFVIEHLYPRELLAWELLDHANELSRDRVVGLLAERVTAAVVTRDEDRVLPTAGESRKPWEDYEADPWRRYRDRLDVAAFAPLPAEPDSA